MSDSLSDGALDWRRGEPDRTRYAPRPPAPRPSARAAAGAASRCARDVLRVALELAESAPFRDLTVDEIARAAGISRSAFYNHFRDKHDLLRVAVEEVADELYRMADRWWHGEGPPAERVRVALEGVVAVYAEHAGLLRVATEVSTYDEEVRELWIAIVERFIEATADHIRSEQAKGLITAGARSPRHGRGARVDERALLLHLPRPRRAPARGAGGCDGAGLDRGAVPGRDPGRGAAPGIPGAGGVPEAADPNSG